MMTRFLNATFLILLLGLSCAALAQGGPRGVDVPVPELSLPQISERIAGRFRGRLLSVRLDRPKPHEREFGTDVVYAAEFLTPADNLLTIRLDGDTGMFLLVEGVGLTDARIRP